MDQHSGGDHPQSRVKRRSQNMWRSALLVLAAILAVSFIAGYYLYLHKDQSLSFFNELENSAAGPTTQNSEHSALPTTEQSLQDGYIPAEGQTLPLVTGKEQEPPVTQAVEEPANQQQPLAVIDSPPQLFKHEIEAYYAHLDQKAYLQDLGIKESSSTYFNKLLQKLADNPPIVLRETDDLFTLLKNTSHFFRVLGKNNLIILKGIVDGEPSQLEKIFKAYYGLSSYPSELTDEYRLSIPPEARTAYAGYFLNSMGGRLYLFRRAPGTRMLVSYYAIRIIDRANKEGNQPLGIDLRPAIGALIKELEDGGRNLQFRQEYLETLYRLQEKYN